MDKNVRFGNAEEQRCTEQHEAPTAKRLGEAVRSDHGGITYQVAGPTLTAPSAPAVARTPDQLRAAIDRGVDGLKQFGYAAPPYVASGDPANVKPWDNKQHFGTFVQLDAHTVAQHVGAGHYQTYDIDRDLHGHAPSSAQSLDVNAHGAVSDPHAPSRAQLHSPLSR